KYATTGPEIHYDDLKIPYVPSKRVFVAQNNAYFNPAKLVNFYKNWNDTVKTKDSVEVITGKKQYLTRKLTMADWINGLGKAVIDSLTNPKQWDYSKFVSVANNANLDPTFTDAGVVAHIDELIGYVNRIASRKLDNPWHYKLAFPPAWPIPENLAYTNSALVKGGTDGYAVGDLNWFPTQKNQWIKTDIQSDLSAAMPTQYSLEQNYPNPFNPTTNIKFSVPQQGKFAVRVFDLLGREVATLFNGVVNAGVHSVTFNGDKLSSGIFFYNLVGDKVNITKKMMLIK
ncbi:MAG: T9SS type A sorting domain-containing protein, partial [Ignavibacteria bacterium]|nr:T9SS type A sorting domain-containing protein [Ignavibacteria bacterium]